MPRRADHAGDLRRELVDVRAVCSALNLEPSTEERGKWICPRHGGGSLSIRLGADRTMQVRCFGCELAGDVFDLIAEVNGFDRNSGFRKVLAEAAQIAGRYDILDQLEGRAVVRPSVLRPARAPAPVAAPRDYPPRAEVDAFWQACRPVCDDERSTALLVARGVDVAQVVRLDIARAVPALLDAVPRWAWYQGHKWPGSGHRVVVPVYDAQGEMRSVRGWRTTSGAPKRLPPAGFKCGGLVLADARGVAMLRGELEPPRVLVVEGEPDFLSWVTALVGNDLAPAVLGLPGAGAWSSEIAERFPDGVEVIVRTHHDEAGEKYATAVNEALGARCRVIRGAKP